MLRTLTATVVAVGCALAFTPTAHAKPDTATTTTFAPSEPLTPVSPFDIERYMGTWNQIAVIPQIFNLQCVKDTTATYELTGPSTVSVRNRCTTLTGRESSIDGQATVVDPAEPAALRVAFDSVPFQPGPEANYIVAYLDDYELALVGSSDRSSGFVLSRKAKYTHAEWVQIKKIVESKGYNSCAFWTSPLTEGRTIATPLCLFF